MLMNVTAPEPVLTKRSVSKPTTRPQTISTQLDLSQRGIGETGAGLDLARDRLNHRPEAMAMDQYREFRQVEQSSTTEIKEVGTVSPSYVARIGSPTGRHRRKSHITASGTTKTAEKDCSEPSFDHPFEPHITIADILFHRGSDFGCILGPESFYCGHVIGNAATIYREVWIEFVEGWADA